MKIFNKKKETITLKHYKMIFKTVDGEIHECNRISHIDESIINCSALEFYLSNNDFLQDDEGICYPVQNIISVKNVLDNIIENVKKSSNPFQVYYPKKDIEII